MYFMGIDPGSEKSAYAILTYADGDFPYLIIDADKVDNATLIKYLQDDEWGLGKLDVAIEGIQSYGMSVGRSVFDTAYMVGRLQQLCDMLGHTSTIYNRPEYAKAICGTQKISDSILRQSLRLKYGDDVKKDDPLYMLRGSSDKRSAFAVITYHIEKGF